MAGSDEKEDSASVQEIYDALIGATKNITLPRYHYFCSEDDARTFWRGDDNEFITFALNVRPISWTRSAEEAKALEAQYGALRFARDVQKNYMGWFEEEKYENSSRYENWVSEYFQDFEHLNTRHVGSEAKPIDYVCIPEFGFPLPVRGDAKKGPYYFGDHFRERWDSLLKSNLLKESFSCLGTAHREYSDNVAGAQKPPKFVNNIAYVYPNGSEANWTITRSDVLKQKRLSIASVTHNTYGVTIKFNNQTGLQCGVKIGKQTIEPWSERSKLFDYKAVRDLKEKKPAAYDIIGSVFDFQEATQCTSEGKMAQGQFLVYKQSAAKKLDEYLDRHERAKLDVYVTRKGVISVLICYDAYDPTIFLSAVRLQKKRSESCFTHPHIDVFLIPAYNASSDFEKMCRLLSKATKAIVVYLTSTEGREHKNRYKIFVGGIDVLSKKKWEEAAKAAGEAVETHKAKFLIDDTIPGRDNLRVVSMSKALIREALKTSDAGSEPDPTQSLIGKHDALN